MSLSDRERAGAFWAFVTTVLAVAFTVLTTHSERAGAFWAFFATILAVAVRLRSERTGAFEAFIDVVSMVRESATTRELATAITGREAFSRFYLSRTGAARVRRARLPE